MYTVGAGFRQSNQQAILTRRGMIQSTIGGFSMNEHKSFLIDLAETIDRHLPRRTQPQHPGWLR
jgi:hypothetical protein